MIARTADPDDELLTALYVQHQPALRAYVLRRKIPRAFQVTHSPEDVTQHGWQEALAHLVTVHQAGETGVFPYPRVAASPCDARR
jgi:hypothetical protein